MCGGVAKSIAPAPELRLARARPSPLPSVIPHQLDQALSHHECSLNAKLSAQLHDKPPMVTLFGPVLVALSPGTNYVGGLDSA